MTNTIHVFKPELTYQDREVWYGGDVPAAYTDNLTQSRWINGQKTSTDSDVTMLGTAPKLDLSYTPEANKILGGKIATKQDIPVNVTVKIRDWDVTEYVTFIHTRCSGENTDPTNGKFWLHVKTCQLTITKSGGAENESYVFDVYRDGKKYTEVTIWGNGDETIYELPVGAYTIAENTGWSWRYKADNGSAAVLSAQAPSGSITCTNSSTTVQWLNGFSTIVKNVFGVPDGKKDN